MAMMQSKKTADDALARVVSLVGVRDRAIQEMRERLAKEEYPETAVEEALERAANCGILDDERFANSYIRGKLRSGWGERRIKQELRRFGISLDDLETLASEHFDEGDQIERAVAALNRHHSSSKNLHQAKYRFLISKGYSSSVVQTALNQYENQ